MKSCSRRAAGSMGVSGSLPRTTVAMTAPRRVTNEMKAEMFADEDLHYTDVESVKTDFTYEYEKESISTACHGNVDQVCHKFVVLCLSFRNVRQEMICHL